MPQEHQSRSILTCPKCGSSNMAIQDVREMWTFPHQKTGTIPNFNASFVQRVRCADCNVIVWRDAKLDLEKGKKA